MKNSILCILSLAVLAKSAKFPPNFQKCNRKDPKWEQCVLEAAKIGFKQLTKAYPEINLPSLDPINVAQLLIPAGTHGVVNVDQDFKNCKFYGLNTLEVEQFEWKLEQKYVYIEGAIPEVKMLCDYELNGRVLVLPIVGSGPSTMILRNSKVTARFDYEEVQKNQKSYFHFVSHKFTIDPDLIIYNFENLFNGDKQLGDNINKVLNDNYKDVFEDVRSGYEDGLGLLALHIINGMFSKVSIEEALD